jgi:DNA-binding NarL/FixJ family response regulator
VVDELVIDRLCNPGRVAGARGIAPRMRAVLCGVVMGRTNQEIADELGMTEGTVKCHVSRLLDILRVRDRVALVVLYYELELDEIKNARHP